jgi:predicted transcriptional regulator
MATIATEEYGSELAAVTPKAPATLFNDLAFQRFIRKTSPHRWTITKQGSEQLSFIEREFISPELA